MKIIPTQADGVTPIFRPVHPAVQELNQHVSEKLSANHFFKAAIAGGQRAIRLSPYSRELWANLASYYWADQQYEQGLAAAERSISIDNTYAPAHSNRALILEHLERYDEAAQEFDKAIELDPTFLQAQWNRAHFRLAAGDYWNGLNDYEIRLRSRKDRHGNPIYPVTFKPAMWDGKSSLAGRNVYVIGDQGIGDNILFSRYLPWLREQTNKVYLCCGLAAQVLLCAYRGIVDEFCAERTPIPDDADMTIMLSSLPLAWMQAHGGARAPMPWTLDDPGLIARRCQKLFADDPVHLPEPNGVTEGGAPLRVGICWAGNPSQDRNEERSIPFELFPPLIGVHPDVWLYSVQCGPQAADIKKFGADGFIFDLSPTLTQRGFAATGTALMQFDLVITCCTSIAHLAGALNIPAWVVLCKRPYWVWGRGEDMISQWWPSLRLFRQKQAGDWQSLFEHITRKVAELVEIKRAATISTSKAQARMEA